MARKSLPGIKVGCTWTSYMASVHGVLSAAGLWEGPMHQLMGSTGMAFHFIVHQELCPSSVTVYDWPAEHFTMMDRIGIHSEVFLAVNDARLNTFKSVQETAVRRIKASIDRGVGVVIWAPTPLLEFGIVRGYDDGDGVLLVEECCGRPCDPLLYTNLGRSEVPVLFYQVFLERVPVDPEKVYRDALEYAVGEWNKEHHHRTGAGLYASGRKAYQYLARALEKGDFNSFGLSYLLAVYADAKAMVAGFLDDLCRESREITGLEVPAALYREVSAGLKRMTGLVPFPQGEAVSPATAAEVLEVARKCGQIEDQAMEAVARALEE
ncbi:MAG: hypothetical protein AB1445_11275 [Bacillota bacterium]